MTRQRRTRRQLAEPNDVMRPRGGRVENEGDGDDDADDEARAPLCTELVFAQRMMNNHVAFCREDDDVPGCQEATDS